MQGIRFSIVITCYNQRDFILAAVDSALSQRHPLREIIVVDDGSTDGSPEILRQCATSIQLVELSSNRGAIEARNHGAALAKGEYLVFLDGDDVLMPWALEVYDRLITERHPKVIVGERIWFKGAVPSLKDTDAPRKIEFVQYPVLMQKDRSFSLSASGFVVDRQAFAEVGGWSPGIFHLDLYDLAIKLGYTGRTILILSPPTFFYRVHEANSIHMVLPFLQMAHCLIAKERAGEYPGGQHRLERSGCLGGMIFFWTRRALRAGLYQDALRLAASGWPMILAAVICRSIAWIAGLQIVETLTTMT